MQFSRFPSRFFLALLGTTACSGRELAPPKQVVVPVTGMSPTSTSVDDALSSTERRLEAAFLARYSGERLGRYRQLLRDPRNQLGLPSEPASQALLDSLYAARRVRLAEQFGAAHLSLAPSAVGSDDGPAIVVGVIAALRNSRAEAVVIRRQASPTEIILLAANRATAARLAAAFEVAERTRERAQGGTVREQWIDVVGTQVLSDRWREQQGRLAEVLAALETARSRDIPGIGAIRTVSVPVPRAARRSRERGRP